MRASSNSCSDCAKACGVVSEKASEDGVSIRPKKDFSLGSSSAFLGSNITPGYTSIGPGSTTSSSWSTGALACAGNGVEPYIPATDCDAVLAILFLIIFCLLV